MLELYHNDMSTASQKVRFVLSEKKLEWTGHHMNLGVGEQHQPGYLKINANGVVPALVHDGSVFVESTVINEYLEEAFPEHPLLPANPALRARVREWTVQIDENIQAFAGVLTLGIAMRYAQFQKTYQDIDSGLNRIPDIVKRERLRDVILRGMESPFFPISVLRYQRLLKDMESRLSESTWLVGNTLTLADIALSPFITRMDHLQLGFMWANLPKVVKWYERLRTMPSYQMSHTKWFNEKALGLMSEKGSVARKRIQQILDA